MPVPPKTCLPSSANMVMMTNMRMNKLPTWGMALAKDTTTWYKPKKDEISDAAKAADIVNPARASETDGHEHEGVAINFDVKTHTVAMTGFL